MTTVPLMTHHRIVESMKPFKHNKEGADSMKAKLLQHVALCILSCRHCSQKYTKMGIPNISTTLVCKDNNRMPDPYRVPRNGSVF